MSNLKAEKRLDKNGRLVTRHVLAGAPSKAGTAIPSPGLPARSEHPRKKQERIALERNVKALDKVRAKNFSRKKMGIYANQRLEKFYKETYKFSSTDNDFYTVMEKLSFGDTIVLMNAGLKAFQVDEFIERNKYQPSTADNTELVAELRSRGISVASYVAARTNNFVWDENTLDAAETHQLLSARGFGPDYSGRDIYVSHVGCQSIALADMKAIGLDRCDRAYGDFAHLLHEIAKGNAKCTAQELGDMLDHYDKRSADDAKDRTLMCVRSRFAVKYGTQFVESIEDPMVLYYAEDDANDMDAGAAMEFLAYSDQVGSDEPMERYDRDGKWQDLAANKKVLWESGIPVEAAREGLAAGMSAQQIIAVQQNGVAASVSSGWL